MTPFVVRGARILVLCFLGPGDWPARRLGRPREPIGVNPLG